MLLDSHPVWAKPIIPVRWPLQQAISSLIVVSSPQAEVALRGKQAVIGMCDGESSDKHLAGFPRQAGVPTYSNEDIIFPYLIVLTAILYADCLTSWTIVSSH